MAKTRERIGWARVPRQLLGELPGLAPAFLLALMLACVLIPLPQLLVDLLLSASLAFAVLLLVAALRVEVPARFSTFPRLLLLVTAFRLVLNLATTRLILSEADAGQVIDAFAGFVTRGDLVVGAVMFGIVTAIQFFVIARGTERVAEVAARFALDGMPGRQAAIAADLASGVITASEAARRRQRLDTRSDFYGAMDGAVKFVKGDAMVGIVIVGVNLVGGLAIGVGRMGYSVGESLAIYGRLTIGDGLLAQIPAVLVSLAAGVLVSRIESVREEHERGWLSPAMLLVPALLLLGVALVPGMPSLAFAAIGSALLVAAWVATARSSRVDADSEGAERLRLCLPGGFPIKASRISSTLPSLRAQCEAATGVAFPELVVEAGEGRARMELFRGMRRVGSLALTPSGDPELSWLNVAYRLLVESAAGQLNLSDLEAQLQRVGERDPVAVRVTLQRVTLPELLGFQRAFLTAGVPVPPLSTLAAALAEEPVFGEREEAARWPQRLREATAVDWLPAVIEAHGASSALFLRCTSDLVLAIASSTRVEQGKWRCGLEPELHAAARAALLGSSAGGTLIVSTASQRAQLAAFFTDLHPPVPVLALAEFDGAGVDRPRPNTIDEAPFEAALELSLAVDNVSAASVPAAAPI